MTFNPPERQKYVYILFFITSLFSLFVAFSRVEIISLAFTIAITFLSFSFVHFQSMYFTLVPYIRDDKRSAYIKIFTIFGLIMLSRITIYWLTGGVWEKAAMVVITVGTITILERSSLAVYGLHFKNWLNQLIWTISGFSVMWIFMSLTSMIGPMIAGVQVVGFSFNVEPMSLFTIILAVKFLFGNFAEELFFRGFVQTKLKKVSGFWIALLVQSALFALYHINYAIWYGGSDVVTYILWYLHFTFIFGLGMGMIFELTNSIVVTTILHAAYNFFFFSINLVPQSVTSSGLYLLPGYTGYAFALLLVPCFIAYWLRKNIKR